MEVDYYSKYLKYKSKYLELKKQMGGKPERCISGIKEYKCNDVNSCRGTGIWNDCIGFIRKTKCDTKGCDHEQTKHKYSDDKGYTKCNEKGCKCKSYIQSVLCARENCNEPVNEHKYYGYYNCPKQ
jgi:hypothetical protein